MTERIRDKQTEVDSIELEHLEVPPQSALPQTRSIVIRLLAQWILRDAGYKSHTKTARQSPLTGWNPGLALNGR